jgi:probable H4MPT-linked C1 transfer pathway protein
MERDEARSRMVVGVDIGGANLKIADATGRAWSEAFDIWRVPHELASRLRKLFEHFRAIDELAVTMTAELADCFTSKAEGVAFILEQIAEAASGAPIAVWLTSGEFVSVDEACRRPLAAAASNWHALATWAGRLAPRGPALLVDIGSTTTDLIPLHDGLPCSVGFTDSQRLISGELVYTGIRRTPVCCIAPAVPYRNALCPLAAEWFATTGDVYLWLGDLPESPADCHTANGRPATRECARDRLARAICCDGSEVSDDDLSAMARFLAEQQQSQIARAVAQVQGRGAAPIERMIVSGAGEFLARRVLAGFPGLNAKPITSLSSALSPAATDAACAFAVAQLAAERM